MDYDVVILGGGIIGCAVAYELSKYSFNIALIEKEYDIAGDVALANTAIIYDGIECEDTLVAKLEIFGNNMFDEICEKFNVPFKRSGGLHIAGTDKEEEKLNLMYERALSRGIKDISLLDSKQVYEMEPNLNIRVKKALYSKNMGVICPYDLAIAYAEIAFDNGVNFRLEEEVINIEKISKGYRVETNKNKFTCKMVIDTTQGESIGEDTDVKETPDGNNGYLKYFLLDRSFTKMFSNVLLTVGESDESAFMVPAVHGNSIASISTKNNLDYNGALNGVSNLVNGLRDEDILSFYQSVFHRNPIIIDDSSVDKGYIKVTAKHYGEVTMTPYIAKIICETTVSNMKSKLKKDFNDKRREFFKFRYLSDEEKKQLIAMDSKYGKIVCLCQKVTEGEIIDAIRRPLGARTVEGIKRRTGATFGNCQGAYCMNKVVSILARETNKKITDIVKDSKNSRIVLNRIKEFDSI